MEHNANLRAIEPGNRVGHQNTTRRACQSQPARFALLSMLAGIFSLHTAPARAGIDHVVTKDTSGIYDLGVQDAVPVVLALSAAGCALWLGTEDRLGKTCWESGESAVASALAAEGLQWITGRRSPSQTSDPGQWFAGGKGSFPSTHVSVTTAVVTPVIYQYFPDNPWVATLGILPAYEMVARVKAQEHWQTDVIAGAALGFAIGAYETHRDNPFVFMLLPGGAYLGIHRSF
jgi:PAP2 superfamily